MDSRRYSSSLDNAVYRGSKWMLIAMLLAISNLVLLLYCLGDEEQRVVLLPPKLERAVWLHGAEVSDSYLEQMAVYVAELALSYHPENVHYRVKQFLRYATTEAYPVLAENMRRDADSIKRNNVSAVFYPKEVRLRPEQRKAIVSGIQSRMVGGKSMSERQLAVLVTFSMDSSLLVAQMREVPEDALDPFVVLPGNDDS